MYSQSLFIECVQIGDLYYNLWKYSKEAEVTHKSENFEGWDITTANIPSSVEYNTETYIVTHIRDGAFKNCSSLTSVTIPNSVTSIGNSAFNGCTGLTSVTIPNSVTSIGNSAFYGCSMLQYLTLGTGVNSIGINAFNTCTYLINIHAKMAFPPTIDSNVFSNCGELSGITLNVPQSSLAQYKKANIWKDFNIQGANDKTSNYTLTFRDKKAEILDSQFITIAIPDAPVINGFTFIKWQIVEGDLENGIIIQAIYKADEPSAASEVVINSANKTQKLVRKGNVYILRGDHTYTLTGQEVK